MIEKLPLPELGIVLVLFLVTLLICYCIWYILFGKRFPLKEKKKEVRKVDNCTLNEIMGYDFIQIKNVKPSVEKNPSAPEKEEKAEEKTSPALYATTSTSQHNDETEDADNLAHSDEQKPQESQEEKPPVVIDFTDDDYENIAKLDWEDWAVNENDEDTSNNIYFDEDEDSKQDDDPPTDDSVEQERAFSEYINQTYDLFMACSVNEEDEKALQQMMNDESFNFKEPDVDTESNEL